MKKLSKKEREEVVTKGYLVDYLESQNYITKEYLESKNYVTKDYLEDKFAHYFGLISEDFTQKITVAIEGLEIRLDAKFARIDERFDRLERRMWRSENWLSNHEDRILKLEDGK
ncbi:hypothetical protein H6775_03045 [Candidatus Nomurabacteria bacterium]|nr:hypothetical protein [Candidatus Nomurabacteria bacterium]